MEPRSLVGALVALLAPLAHAQVEGVVVNRVTGDGIGGVAVLLYTRQAIQYETVTDASGHFHAANMRAGSYQVRYEKPRFKPFRENPASPYTVAPNSAPQLRLEMTPLITLRGRVLNPDGNPARRAQVRVGSFNAFVDERGEFEFDQLQPGSYTMLAEPGPVPPGPDGIQPVQTAFPRRIVVRGDVDLSGYDIRLQALPVHRVRGVVRNEAGQPLLATLRLFPAVQHARRALEDTGSGFFLVVGPERGDGPLLGSTTSGDDGAFEFPSVPAGDWRIAADASGRVGEAAFSVNRSDIDGLEVRVTRPGAFSLNVTVDWGNSPPVPRLLTAMPGQKTILENGSVRLDNVRPGRYRVTPLAEPGYNPESTLLGQIVDFSAGMPALKISYRTPTASVSGTASPGAIVVLLPNTGYGRIAQCGPDGAFSVAEIAPGEYFVSAFERFDTSFLTDPGLLSKITAAGTKVTVGSNPIGALELKLTSWPE